MIFSKSNDNIKIAIVMPVWAPMRHLLFEGLAVSSGVNLKIFFEKKELPHRPTWVPISSATYDYEIINSYHPEWLKRYRLIPYRLPYFLSRYQPDIIVVSTLTEAFFALIYTSLSQKRLILWTGESEHILAGRSMPMTVRLIRKILYPLIDGFGCYSKETMFFLKHAFGVPSSKIFQIPQCVEQSHFMRGHEDYSSGEMFFPESSNKFIFLSVGRFVYLKGYDLLINAWAKLPREIAERSVLRIAATGPLKRDLDELIQRSGLSNVELIGFVDYEALPFLYNSADVFILPTREDTWGLVVNEAMAARLPVLCSKYAHAREMIVERENGYVFDPINLEDTISKIEMMYKRRSEWDVMGKRGREMVEKHYSVESAAKAMMKGIERSFQKHRK